MRWFLAGFLFLCLPTVAAQSAGSASLGDSIYPWMGNGGYDVQRYDIDLRISHDLRTLRGTTIIEALATQDLSAFNLDLGRPKFLSVSVNGVAAEAVHQDPELTVTPQTPLRRGETFRVKIEFSGAPGSRVRGAGLDETAWGVGLDKLLVMAQPSRLLDWTPANDSPVDKARFRLRLTAPRPYTIIANGTPEAQTDNADNTTTRSFRLETPTTTYGVFFALGNQLFEDAAIVDGVQIRHYLSPSTSSLLREAAAQSGAMLQFFAERLGAYPFPEFGVFTHTFDSGYALETQGLVSIPADWGGSYATPQNTLGVVSHELAHQWFGMLVTYRDHRDIWLHEGFATYLSWLYLQHTLPDFRLEAVIAGKYASAVNGRRAYSFSKPELLEWLRDSYGSYSLFEREVPEALDILFNGALPVTERVRIEKQVKSAVNLRSLAGLLEPLAFTRVTLLERRLGQFFRLLGISLNLPEDDRFIAPGRVDSGALIFNRGVYERGAMALYALHQRLGDSAFWEALRGFLGAYRFANASNQDFLDFIRQRAGQEAASELQNWLLADRAPDLPNLGLYATAYLPGADFK